MSDAALDRRSVSGRAAYAGLALLLLVAMVFEAIKHDTGYWQIAAFGLGPDLALLYGAGGGLEKGQLHRRAVRAYNLVHRFWGPFALATLASFDVIPLGFFVGALAWGFHIALDRALGYGLRTPDGFQSAHTSARPLQAGINEGAPVVGASEIEIDAAPQPVWDVLTTFEGWPSWNPDVKSSRSRETSPRDRSSAGRRDREP